MKKLTPKRNGHSRQVGGGLSALHREIKGMSARGLVEDQIGLRVGLDKNQLRARYIDAVKEGRVIAAKRREARAAAVALTPEEYHFLDAATPSFTSHWFDTVSGNLLFDGMDGNGARDIADAFARWKADGGKYICTGLSNRFDRKKVAQFAKIVADYRRKFERGPKEEIV